MNQTLLRQLSCLVLGMLSGLTFAGAEEACYFNQGYCPYKENAGRHGYIQDYGYGGFSSQLIKGASLATNPVKAVYDSVVNGGVVSSECTLNPATPIVTGAATLWNGNAGDPNRVELRAIQEAGKTKFGYSLTGEETTKLLNTYPFVDDLQEELMFLTAIDDVSQFNECQNGLFRDFFEKTDIKASLLQNAWQQFKDIRSNKDVLEKFREAKRKRSDVIRADTITSCIKDSCRTPTVEDIARIRDRNDNDHRVKVLQPEINLIVSRIPLGNRDSLRIEMENLLLAEGVVSEGQFKRVYEEAMLRLNESLQESRALIKSIRVDTEGRHYHCVDRNLKENLYRSGQLDHTIHRLGLGESLKNFKLRSQNRYGLAGTVITEVAMIPSYFVGYGAARLALRAGASTVRAVSSSGRVLAGATRVAMLGLEAVDYSSAISTAIKACDRENFISRVDGQSCHPTDEIGFAYEEASLAQCLTLAVLPVASAFVGSGVRFVESKKTSPLNAVVSPSEELFDDAAAIVLQAPKPARLSYKSSSQLTSKRVREILADYPLINTKWKRMGRDAGEEIVKSRRINSPEEIPFKYTDTFRPVSTDEMIKRSMNLDPEISIAIVRAYNALNDKTLLKTYFRELYLDAALWMKHKGRTADLEKLEQGFITEQAIAVVLVRRAKERGDTNFTTLKNLLSNDGTQPTIATGKIPTEDEILASPNKSFRFSIRTGPFIDRNFPQGDLTSNWGHGPFAHMIQREIIMDHVRVATNGNPQKFWSFLGSAKGVNFWADLFDSGNLKSMTRPETLTGYMLRELCGITN